MRLTLWHVWWTTVHKTRSMDHAKTCDPFEFFGAIIVRCNIYVTSVNSPPIVPSLGKTFCRLTPVPSYLLFHFASKRWPKLAIPHSLLCTSLLLSSPHSTSPKRQVPRGTEQVWACPFYHFIFLLHQCAAPVLANFNLFD